MKGWDGRCHRTKKKKREKGQIKAATLRFERRTILEIGEKQGDIEHRSFEKRGAGAAWGKVIEGRKYSLCKSKQVAKRRQSAYNLA
jgi:hypothetical protein